MVLDETWVAPGGSEATMPSAPNATASTARSSDSMVNTTSALLASATLPAAVAPCWTRASALPGERLYTVTR